MIDPKMCNTHFRPSEKLELLGERKYTKAHVNVHTQYSCKTNEFSSCSPFKKFSFEEISYRKWPLRWILKDG